MELSDFEDGTNPRETFKHNNYMTYQNKDKGKKNNNATKSEDNSSDINSKDDNNNNDT